MTPTSVRKLKVNDEIAVGSLSGRVTCVDLTDDDKIVVKWDCCESEDVLCEASPLWSGVSHI
jgi:hypothetical protein